MTFPPIYGPCVDALMWKSAVHPLSYYGDALYPAESGMAGSLLVMLLSLLLRILSSNLACDKFSRAAQMKQWVVYAVHVCTAGRG